MDYTDDTKRPNRPESRPEGGAHQFYIEDTKGLWVRKNRAEDELEIWFDGAFQSSWSGCDEIEGRLTALLREAVEIGERKAKAEIRSFLGCR